MNLLVVVACAFIGVSLTTARTIEELSREEDRETERIIRGSDAVTGQFPYAVALHLIRDNNDGQFICTASIISPTTVMTAAHCVILDGELQPADRIYLIANLTRTSPTQRINVASITPHPDYYRQKVENDVAILKTVEEIEFSDEVGPVCIAGPDTTAMQYENATAMGWGNVSPFRLVVIIPKTLQYVEQTIVQNSACSALLAPGVNDNKLCATGLFTGVCNGDSGGPLVHLSADQPPVQIGIASYVNGVLGCGKSSPAVFARVSSYYDFITQTAQDDSICVV